ncbi:MAG: nucleotidyl transferase AbiEii/AbiGii toxin family protein [Solirubrobacteraceae bacterium]
MRAPVETWADFRPTRLLAELVGGGVDFVVIGGVAVVAQASPRFTKDLDICYSAEPQNLAALGAVLVDMGARLRGVDEDVAFVPDDRTLRQTQILTLTTPHGGLDLLVDPAGAPPYPKLRERADVLEIEGFEVRVACLDDLLAMKYAAGRPQDRIDIEALEIAKRRRRR